MRGRVRDKVRDRVKGRSRGRRPPSDRVRDRAYLRGVCLGIQQLAAGLQAVGVRLL